MNKQFVKVAVAALAMGAGAGFTSQAAATPGVPTVDATAESMENFNYGVCRGTDPTCYHEWGVARTTPPGYPNGKVLLFTRTAGPRHASIGTALVAGVFSSTNCTDPATATGCPNLGTNNNTQKDMIRLLYAQGIAVDYTETVTNLSNLNQYKAVIFFSNSRDALWDHGRAVNPTLAVSTTTGAHLDQAKTLLRQYMRAGGGFVAVHNAHGTEYNWPYYEGLLGNSNYYDHGNFQNGTMYVVNNDPSTSGVGFSKGTSIPFKDEWYNLVPYPTNVKFLLALDENTLATKRATHPGFPSFHPVAWCQYYNGGRAWITTLGHDALATSATPGVFPGAAEFQKILVAGIKSAMGIGPFCN